MKYFLHVLAVGFFSAAVTYKSWLLGLCSVMVVTILTASELYKEYLNTKVTNETVKALKQIAEDQVKFERKMDEWQTELGRVSYTVNQMETYVGSPRN